MAEVKQFTKIWHCTKLQNSTQSGSAFIPTQPQNIAPSSYLKTASNKIIIQIKLAGMSMISYYTTVHLSTCNSSWVVSTKQTMNFNIQLAAMFVFFVFDKNGLLNSCSSFEALSVYTQFHGPTLTGASFASTSVVWTSAILEWLKVQD
jgi:hypothetical protein